MSALSTVADLPDGLRYAKLAARRDYLHIVCDVEGIQLRRVTDKGARRSGDPDAALLLWCGRMAPDSGLTRSRRGSVCPACVRTYETHTQSTARPAAPEEEDPSMATATKPVSSSLTLLVGERVRSEREKRGLSIVELATRCGVTAGTIEDIEAGGNSTVFLLGKLAGALKVPPAALLEEEAGPAADDRPTLERIAEWLLEHAAEQDAEPEIDPRIAALADHPKLEKILVLADLFHDDSK